MPDSTPRAPAASERRQQAAKESSLLAAALEYARRGWPVLPLHGITPQRRCTCGAPECENAAKHPVTTHGLKDASTDLAVIRSWWTRWPSANIGILTGAPSGLVVIDVDGPAGLEALLALASKSGEIPQTVRSRTRRGFHVVFRHPGGRVKSCSALAGRTGLDVRGDGGYIVAPPSRHASGVMYEWEAAPDEVEIAPLPEWLHALLTGPTNGNGHRGPAAPVVGPIPDGKRGDSLASLAGTMRRRGMTEGAIAAALLEENAKRCDPPLPEGKVRDIAKSISKYEPAERARAEQEDPPVETWPDPPAAAAYHGPFGEIVRAIEPHTEADPVAILVQLLIGFGNLIGSAPYFLVEGSGHRVKEFSVLVGSTAKGRKGTSWDQTLRGLAAIDPDWARDRIVGGLSSGEGVIHAVRDARVEKRPIMVKGECTGYTEVETDPGVTDKRLLCVESEFSRVLKVMERESSTLSEILRQAWDRQDLHVLTKAPTKATGTHVSIIAHITAEELQRQLHCTEAANGFGNRFIWLAVRRARLLPEGGSLDFDSLTSTLERLRAAVARARATGEMRRDEDARALWCQEYPRLSAGRAGLLGAMLSRAEPHVLRVSMIYALADGSPQIRRPHLEAALALWDYSERSAAFIFGDSLGDPTADELLRALRAAPNGMTRGEMSDYFGRNKSSAEISRAVGVLSRAGLARVVKEKHEGPGRPAERWYAIREGGER